MRDITREQILRELQEETNRFDAEIKKLKEGNYALTLVKGDLHGPLSGAAKSSVDRSIEQDRKMIRKLEEENNWRHEMLVKYS